MISTFPIRDIKVLLYRSKVSRYGIFKIPYTKFVNLVLKVSWNGSNGNFLFPTLTLKWLKRLHSHNSHHIMPLCKFWEGCWISLLILSLTIVSHYKVIESKSKCVSCWFNLCIFIWLLHIFCVCRLFIYFRLFHIS